MSTLVESSQKGGVRSVCSRAFSSSSPHWAKDMLLQMEAFLDNIASIVEHKKLAQKIKFDPTLARPVEPTVGTVRKAYE
ncbi:hypothetical protein FRC10_011426 [Ceratobasidium sp. 414]|nr:hypothetical protein FRC10_011426 [Ceratobasidium sp. 414]